MNQRIGRVFLKAMIQSSKLKDLSPFIGGELVPKGTVAAAFPPGTRLMRDVSKEHQANLHIMQRILNTIKTVCNIDNELVDEDVLIRKLLKYPVTFLDILGDFFKYSNNIGDCDHNIIIQFGKGLRYITNAGSTLKTIIDQYYPNVNADLYDIVDLIRANIKKNRLYYADLVIEAL